MCCGSGGFRPSSGTGVASPTRGRSGGSGPAGVALADGKFLEHPPETPFSDFVHRRECKWDLGEKTTPKDDCPFPVETRVVSAKIGRGFWGTRRIGRGVGLEFRDPSMTNTRSTTLQAYGTRTGWQEAPTVCRTPGRALPPGEADREEGDIKEVLGEEGCPVTAAPTKPR